MARRGALGALCWSARGGAGKRPAGLEGWGEGSALIGVRGDAATPG